MKTFIKRIFFLAMFLLFVIGLNSFTSAFGFSDGADSVKLSKPDESGNIAFSCTNMFPGDSVTKDFNVVLKGKNSNELFFHADIRPGGAKLSEVLMFKVEIPSRNAVLYDGLMRDMPFHLSVKLNESEHELLWRFTVYLDTSVGNEYQYKSLTADFRWWYLSDDVFPGFPGGSDEPLAGFIKPVAEKVVNNAYPRGNDFTFVLADANMNVIQRVKNRDGFIEFDNIIFDEPGTYKFYLYEEAGRDQNIEYDDSVYTLIATVTENNGVFSTDVKCERDGISYLWLPRFTNLTKDWIADTSRPGEDTEDTDDNEDTDGTDTGGDTSVPPSDTTVEDPENPKTGDSSNPGAYIMILAVSIAAIAAILVILLKKRRREDEENV